MLFSLPTNYFRQSPLWAFLISFKKAAKSVPRSVIVTEMGRNSAVARFISGIFPAILVTGSVSDAVINFNTAILLDFIARSSSLSDEDLAFLLPDIMAPLSAKSGNSATVSNDSTAQSQAEIFSLEHSSF